MSPIATDMKTALKSREEDIAQQELLDQTEMLLRFGSWTWEPGSSTLTCTRGLCAMLGYSPEELPHPLDLSFFLKHINEEFRSTFQTAVEGAVQSQKDFDCEFIIRTRSGTAKNVSAHGKVITANGDEVQQVICINRDITAQRTFEREREQSVRDLDRSNKELEEFAYIASHDLQEPLRKISMFTERLKAKYEKSLDKEGELFIDRIMASTVNMRALIDSLLEFSRANRITQPHEEVDLGELVESVLRDFQLRIDESQGKVDIEGQLPVIEAVAPEIRQVFTNILSNAVKFRKSDDPLHIHVRSGKLQADEATASGLSASVPFVKVEIQDNGIGFDPEYSEKIFQIFQRLNGKSEYPGSGVGLAICKKIIEKHGGLISAKGDPETGTTITLILPEKRL